MRTIHPVLLTAAFVLLPACSKGNAAAIASLGSDALVDQLDLGKIGLSIAADGKVKAAVESSDGKPLSSDAKGTVSFKSTAGEAKTVALTFDRASGALVADGPKLEGDLTQVSYALDVGGKPMEGNLYVPAGGTAQIVADAKAGASTATPGPHGGVTYVVGKDRLELVSDGGEKLRMYVLGADGKVVPVEKQSVTLGVVAERPETVVLVPEPQGRFLTGTWHAHTDPSRLVIASRADAAAHANVVLAGFTPGAALDLRASAPHVKVTPVAKLDDVDGDGRVAAGGEVKLQGNGNPIGTGMGKGNGNANGNGNLNAKANANAHADGNAKGGAHAAVAAPAVGGKASAKIDAPGNAHVKGDGHLGASLNIH